MLAVDRNGAVVDGDELMALAALHLREHGRLPGDGVAVTVMTNFGFHQAMERARASRWPPPPVGDRHVLAELLRARLGAGRRAVGPHHRHRLRARRATASPRPCSTLEALGGRDLADRDAMEKLPQRLINVRVGDREALERAPPTVLGGGRARVTSALEGRGRVLVRPSGTEPLVRVMVEAPRRGSECGRDRLVALVERG